jgi:hypothetical protein
MRSLSSKKEHAVKIGQKHNDPLSWDVPSREPPRVSVAGLRRVITKSDFDFLTKLQREKLFAWLAKGGPRIEVTATELRKVTRMTETNASLTLFYLMRQTGGQIDRYGHPYRPEERIALRGPLLFRD